jgi:methionyl-tRNA formyltransferase
MNFRIAVLSSQKSWFQEYAERLVNLLIKRGYDSSLFWGHESIPDSYNIVFILSYFRIIPDEHLKLHKHNLVVHESNLPEGRGWSPLFWQVLEGKNKIPVVLFEATANADEGKIYFKDYIELNGFELHDEIRKIQAEKTIELCIRFINEYDSIQPVAQTGNPSYYKKRAPVDSKLNPDKTILDQFNLLRIVSNEEFPAFFFINNRKYILKIYPDFQEEKKPEK